MHESSIVFTRTRADGWTIERQRAFLEALADCGSVRSACAKVSISPQAAYALRRRSDARAFRQAWDAARAFAAQRLEEAAWDRAIHGTVKQHFYHGELVAETRVYSDRLLVQLLDRNRAALDMAETEPDVLERVMDDWDAALDRLDEGDWLRSEDELDEEWLEAMACAAEAEEEPRAECGMPRRGGSAPMAACPAVDGASLQDGATPLEEIERLMTGEEADFSCGASTSSTSAPP